MGLEVWMVLLGKEGDGLGIDGVEILRFLMERFGGDWCGWIGIERVNGLDGDGGNGLRKGLFWRIGLDFIG